MLTQVKRFSLLAEALVELNSTPTFLTTLIKSTTPSNNLFGFSLTLSELKIARRRSISSTIGNFIYLSQANSVYDKNLRYSKEQQEVQDLKVD